MARGEFRQGTGRLSGSTNKSSPEQSQRLSELAKTYTEEALQTLVDVAKSGRTDAARLSAADALLDRAYGKPAVKEEKEIVDLPPAVIQLTGLRLCAAHALQSKLYLHGQACKRPIEKRLIFLPLLRTTSVYLLPNLQFRGS